MIDSKINFYRGPMKVLLEEVMSVTGLERKEAKEMISNMLGFLERKVWAGQEVNLGFMKIIPKKLSPITVRSKLKTAKGTYFLGERTKWRVAISRKWEKEFGPAWGKP